MALNAAEIDGVPVAGFSYIVYGRERGLVSTHRAKLSARWSLAMDARNRTGDGRTSDARIYQWRGGWELVESDIGVALAAR